MFNFGNGNQNKLTPPLSQEKINRIYQKSLSKSYNHHI